jgi:PIN domain nuclease of toxin-antitoxin system
MKLLLDTHVFLSMHGEPARLTSRARKLLIDADSELHLSVVVP